MKSPSLTSTSDDNKAAPQGSPPFDNDHEEFDFYAMVHPDRPRKEKNEVTTKGKAVLEAHPYIITRYDNDAGDHKRALDLMIFVGLTWASLTWLNSITAKPMR